MNGINAHYIPLNSQQAPAEPAVYPLEEKTSLVGRAALILVGMTLAGAGIGAIAGSVVPVKGTILGAAAGALIGLIIAIIILVRMTSQHYEFLQLQSEVEQFKANKNAITLPKALQLSQRLDQFRAKHKGSFSLDLSEIQRLQDSLLDSVQNEAKTKFNALRNKVIQFTIEPENANTNNKGTALINDISQFEEDFGCRSPDGKLTGKIFAKAIKEYRIEKKDVENLKNKVLLLIQKDLPSFDLIAAAIDFQDTPLTSDEAWFCQQFAKKFPNLSAAKSKYRSLKNLPLIVTGNEKPEKFNGTSFTCKQLAKDPANKFFVHTTSSDTILKKMKDQSLGGTICASLISGNTSFFHPESNIAIILEVDPACIATTAKEDVQSPMYNPAKNADHQVVAKKYYDFHKKFQTLATYVDLIYKNFYGAEATDDFTLFQRLLAQEEYLGEKIKNLQPHCENLGSENSEHLQKKLELARWTHGRETLQKQILQLQTKHKDDPIFQSKNQWKIEGVTSFQLRTLISHFKSHPDENRPENFQAIFGRDGQDVLAELEKGYQFVQNILNTGDVLSKMNISRFLDPDELLAQTHNTLDHGYFNYNEVGLDLRPETGFDASMLQVYGILIDRALMLNRKNADNPNLSQIIQTAKEHKIPIYFRD